MSQAQLKLRAMIKSGEPLNEADQKRALRITKKCLRCLKNQRLEFFNKQPTGKLGRRNMCRKCQSKDNAILYQKKKANLLAKELP